MTYTRAWRLFRRMQDSVLAAALLLYFGAAVYAWRALPFETGMKAMLILAGPWMFAFFVFAAAVLLGPLRRGLKRFLWMSFQSGFGQSVPSVLGGVAVLGVAALFIYRQIAESAGGEPTRANAFAAYAAGIGILAAQAVLVRALERDPDARAVIEER